MPVSFDVCLEQVQEGADVSVFVFGISTADNHLAALLLENQLVARADSQHLADGSGQGDLPLRGQCPDLSDLGHGSSPVSTHPWSGILIAMAMTITG